MGPAGLAQALVAFCKPACAARMLPDFPQCIVERWMGSQHNVSHRLRPALIRLRGLNVGHLGEWPCRWPCTSHPGCYAVVAEQAAPRETGRPLQVAPVTA